MLEVRANFRDRDRRLSAESARTVSLANTMEPNVYQAYHYLTVVPDRVPAAQLCDRCHKPGAKGFYTPAGCVRLCHDCAMFALRRLADMAELTPYQWREFAEALLTKKTR